MAADGAADGATNGTAVGTFEVTMTPLGAAEDGIGAMAIEKTFHGDLTGTSVGRFLGVRTPHEGSAGYVAMERVTGALAGRHGSFVLQHSGTLNRGAAQATISVIPDSGTDGLAGLAGAMVIDPSGGRHSYVFTYALPD